ncbi:MAG TPA: PKD domain-containing protein [Ferruginibacter sp.]|nr:PKD domain-containing protein [Ferruginibacter sp.]
MISTTSTLNTNTDINETNRNYYRISVQDPTTIVKRNGVVMTGLINNFYYECADSTGGDYFESDKPMLVSQYTPNANQCWMPPPQTGGSYGDPEMFYLSPIEQGQKSVLFYTSRNANINYVYTNIILPTTAINSLKVDGNPISSINTRIHPNNPNYTVAVERLIGPAAQHTITCDSTFTAIVYGLGYYESYGYNVGTNINNLNSYSAIKNTFNTSGNIDTFTCRNTPVRLFAKIAYPATSIRWRLSQVPGITPNVDSIINNPIPLNTESINGRTYYVYTLQQDFTFANQGTFTIPISYTAALIPNCNQTEYASVTVVVKPGPQADFSIPSACPNQSIVLTGTSSTNGFNIGSYLWNFPDGSTQTTVNATKSFPAIGSYPVRYRIYADNGCAGDTTKTVVIGSPVSLSVQAIGKACADSVFTFTSSIPVNAANPPSWYWDFGDGNSATITNSNTITHSYTALGVTRTLRHAVGFTTGCGTDTVTYIIPVINSNPTAAFSFVSDTLCEKRPVQFNAALTGISSWLWNFGNGTSTASPPLQHTFTNAGSFNVSLVVKDVNGCGSLPATNIVTINSLPVISAGPDKYFRFGNPVTLDASISNPGNYDFIWTPATYLNLATILNPVASPDRKMIYTVVATDKSTHCAASDSVLVKPISIVQVPNAFTPNNDGKNDLFKVLGTEMVTQFNFKIFNRYGQLVFETSDKNQGWDGKWKGQPVLGGGFIYIITYSAPNYPDAQVVKGSFVLIR